MGCVYLYVLPCGAHTYDVLRCVHMRRCSRILTCSRLDFICLFCGDIIKQDDIIIDPDWLNTSGSGQTQTKLGRVDPGWPLQADRVDAGGLPVCYDPV